MGRQPAGYDEFAGFHAPREHHDGGRSTGKHLDHARDAEERGHAGQCNGRNQRNHVADGAGGVLERRNGFDVRQRRGRLLAVVRSFRGAVKRAEQ